MSENRLTMLVGELKCQLARCIALVDYNALYLIITQIDIYKEQGSFFYLWVHWFFLKVYQVLTGRSHCLFQFRGLII